MPNRYSTSRRGFLASAAAFPFALRAMASPVSRQSAVDFAGDGDGQGNISRGVEC